MGGADFSAVGFAVRIANGARSAFESNSAESSKVIKMIIFWETLLRNAYPNRNEFSLDVSLAILDASVRSTLSSPKLEPLSFSLEDF